MKRSMLWLFLLLFTVLNFGAAMHPPKAVGPKLEIVTTPVVTARGDTLSPIAVSLSPDGYLEFTLTLMNTGDLPWWSPDPATHSDMYVNLGGKWNIKDFVTAKLTGPGGTVYASATPWLYDLDENVAIRDETIWKYIETSSWNGFHIAAGWANTTTDNNVGALGAPAGRIRLDPMPPPGDYRLDITVNDVTPISGSVSVTISGSVTQKTALKIHGKR